MLRLSPPEHNRIEQSVSFASTYGGSEANIAISLACLGDRSEFFTQLPKNQLGSGAIRHLKGYGVGLDNIKREHDNMGIYFLETGFGGRPSRVIYNRRYSAITSINIDDLDMDSIFGDACWFHVSGITLALSLKTHQATLLLVKEAKKRGLFVSFDFNYRAKLWTIEACRESCAEILPYVDVLFASHFDITEIMKFEPRSGLSNDEALQDVFKQMFEKYSLKYIFGTKRVVYSADENSLSAFVYTYKNDYLSKIYRFRIYDRVGGGDAFASGVIHELNKDFNNYHFACEFGLALSVLKHTIQGDAAVFSEKEVIEFLNNNSVEISR